MESVDELGAVVTGGLAARAVEPAAGEGRKGGAGACLNCGTALIGNHCHECGQSGHVHRSLAAFWHDFVHGVLHFDGKIWRTLPMLAWRPGALTRRYIEGERARFVSPMALFLFSVFTMFAVFSAIGGPFDLGIEDGEFRNTKAEMAAALRDQRKTLEALRAERAEEFAKGDRKDVERLDVEIRDSQKAVTALESFARTSAGQKGPNMNVNSRWQRLDKGAKKLAENPSLAIYKVQNNAYKFSWLLIPLSVPFVWLLFPFSRKWRLYDHTVFVTYSLSFMTLLMVALSFGRLIGLSDSLIGWATGLVPPIHLYRQLKGAYGLRWWSAALRAVLLILFSGLVVGLFVALLVVLGALG
jgi:hypothetical protein